MMYCGDDAKGGVRIVASLVRLNDSDVTTCAIQNLTWNRDRGLLKKVLKARLNFSLERRDNTGYTPLMAAVNLADLDIAQALLEAKASANVTDETKRTVIQLCALRCPKSRGDICKLLMRYGGRFCHPAFEKAYLGDLQSWKEGFEKTGADMKKSELRKDSSGHTVLHYASANGHLDYLRSVIKASPETVSVVSKNGDTALLLAAKNGHRDCLKLLMDNSSEQTRKVTDKFGRDPLMCAARFGHKHVVQWLHESKASLDRKSVQDAESPLTCAAYGGHIPCIEYLLVNGAYHDDTIRVPNQPPPSPISISSSGTRMSKGKSHDSLDEFSIMEEGETSEVMGGSEEGVEWEAFAGRSRWGLMPLLFYALEKSELAISKWLHNHGCAWENRLTQHLKHTAYMRAAVGGSLECLQWVAQNCRGSVCGKTVDGCSALHYAVVNDNLRVAKRLLAMGSEDTPDSTGNTLVLSAAKEGSLWCLQWLLELRPRALEEKNALNQTPLLVAISGNQIVTAQWLIRKKADVNVRDSNGHGLLLTAAKAGSCKMIEWLLSANLGGGIGIKDAVGRTPLILASSCNHLDAVKMLLDNKANIQAMSICNLTPLLWASWLGCDKVVQCLLDNKANIQDLSLAGESCLHLAAKCTSTPWGLNTAQLLVERGNDPSLLDYQSKSPAYVAGQNGNLPMLKWLIEKGHAKATEDDSKGTPMLFDVSETKHLAVVKYLVEQKAPLAVNRAVGSSGVWVKAEDVKEDEKRNLKFKIDAALLHAVNAKMVANVRYLVKVTNEPGLEETAYKATTDEATRAAIDISLQDRTHKELVKSVLAKALRPPLLRLVTDYVSYARNSSESDLLE